MKAIVTGAAGFIGSRLATVLVESGWDCVGIDRISDYYDTAEKLSRVDELTRLGVEFRTCSISPDNLDVLGSADVVFHLAAQPGVRRSWDDMSTYLTDNILASNSVAKYASQTGSRVVFASSSSVYGNLVTTAVSEEAPLHPFSPYGVTKSSCEQLFQAYVDNFGISVVALRYFTVYGPGQRPDMAMRRLFECARTRTPFVLYGDGSSSRQFTYVDDVVSATISAATTQLSGFNSINICGGSTVSMSRVIELCQTISDREIPVDIRDRVAGDVQTTHGISDKARKLLRWEPSIDLPEGLAHMWNWMRKRYDLT